jgi:hypothetical protein
MKLVLCLCVAAVLAVAFCVLASAHVANESELLLQGLEGVEQAVAAEDWALAGELLRDNAAIWDEERHIWQGLMNHQDVGNIDTAFISLSAFLKDESEGDVLNQLALLKYYLQLVVESDRINWHNFF